MPNSESPSATDVYLQSKDYSTLHHDPHSHVHHQPQSGEHASLATDTSPFRLPAGWTLTGRQRSTMELETNIHTLGEFYRTLSDLRKELPSPVADEVEKRSFAGQHGLRIQTAVTSDTDDSVSITPTSSGGIGAGVQSPSTELQQQKYTFLLGSYPGWVFEYLIQLHLDCTSYLRNKQRFLDTFKQGRANSALMCSIFAYSAVHAQMCHSDRLGPDDAMLTQLANECYQIAYDLVEFDAASRTTIETLVMMHLYNMAVGQEGEAHNLFYLAIRHSQLLNQTDGQQDTWRLKAWIMRLDFGYPGGPITTTPMTQTCCAHTMIRPTAKDDAATQQTLRALQLQLTGLRLIADPSTTVSDLEQWRDSFRQKLDHKNDLRLHALYFAARLHCHQSEMMREFEGDARWKIDPHKNWTDYFHPGSLPPTTQRLETALQSCIESALGLVNIVRMMIHTKDSCILPDLVDTLSAACTVLYFGNKVVLDAQVGKQSQKGLDYLLDALSQPSMLKCPRIDSFVQRWRSVT